MNPDEERRQLSGISEMITRTDPVLARRLAAGPHRRPPALTAANLVLALCVALSLLGLAAHRGGVALVAGLLLMTAYPLLLIVARRP